jgi:hypothetical protein
MASTGLDTTWSFPQLRAMPPDTSCSLDFLSSIKSRINARGISKIKERNKMTNSFSTVELLIFSNNEDGSIGDELLLSMVLAV